VAPEDTATTNACARCKQFCYSTAVVTAQRQNKCLDCTWEGIKENRSEEANALRCLAEGTKRHDTVRAKRPSENIKEVKYAPVRKGQGMLPVDFINNSS
jgi:hypothetical protein